MGILILALTAMFKFLLAAIFLVSSPRYTPTEAFEILFFSGTFILIVFYFFGKIISQFTNQIISKYKKKKSFKKLRKFVNIKNKLGFWILILTFPISVTIPVGAFLASRFFNKKKGVLIYMIGSVFLWSLIPAVLKIIF